jgi:hypothetical protein
LSSAFVCLFVCSFFFFLFLLHTELSRFASIGIRHAWFDLFSFSSLIPHPLSIVVKVSIGPILHRVACTKRTTQYSGNVSIGGDFNGMTVLVHYTIVDSLSKQ